MIRSWLIVLVLLASNGVAIGKTFVFVSESRDNRVAVFALDESNGDLKRVGEVALSGSPGCLAINADKSLVYASVRTSGEFATLALNSKTGTLSPKGTCRSLGSAAYIYPDKTGKWLLAAYYQAGKVSVSKIVDGVVVGEPVASLDVGPKAHCIQTDAANRFAFTPHTGELNKVDQFHFDAKDGTLTLNTPAAMLAGEGQGPRHMQFHPNGKWAYLVNEQGKTVTLCDYDGKRGNLTARQTLSTVPRGFETSGSCADIEISADGRFVYASNRGHDSLAVFSIDAQSGELTSLGQTPTEKTPRSFNLIPGGEKFVVAAGQGSNKLVVYRRDPATGSLTKLRSYDCGRGPAWVMGVKLPN